MPAAAETASRLVVVSGAARGIGLGICRQTLAAEPNTQVLCTARKLEQAQALASELNAKYPGPPTRAHAAQLDVSDEDSCIALADALKPGGSLGEIRNPTDPLVVVNNAGITFDLPWFPSPWPPTAAAKTLDVNLFGAERLTRAFLPHLLQSDDGRVIFVSSGGGRANMARMSEENRHKLLSEDLTWEEIVELSEIFTREYEEFAQAAIDAENRGEEDVKHLPFLAPSGLWLQSYGTSKSLMGAYASILARKHPSLLSLTCSPGFIATDMSSTYAKYETLKTVEEGGDVIAWLSTETKEKMQSGVFYQPDHKAVGFVADLN
jgi:NAD(P)-dependent dehydrogenase (short-subunit alcohol dehydrogenase family)